MRHNSKLPDLAFIAQRSAAAAASLSVDPTFYTGLAVWWKADSFALADGTAIGGAGKEWVDQVGNTNHYGRMATVSAQPLFKTNIANGKPGILFTWTSDFTDQHLLDCSNGSDANSITPAGDYTVVAVVKSGGGSTVVGGAIIGNAYTNNYMLGMRTPFDQISAYQPGIGSATIANQSGVLSMYSWVRSGGSLRFYLNKTDVTNGPPSAINAGHFNYLGASVGPAGFERFGGYIFDIFIYTEARTASELANLYDNYLKPKYGLP